MPNTNESKSTHNPSLPKYLITIRILFVVITLLLVLTAPFATDPLALTPVGVLNIIVILLYGGYHVVKTLSRRLNRRYWVSGVIAALLLAAGPPVPPPTVPFWDMMKDNFILMTNPSAWQANFEEVNVNLGLRGLTPLNYRSLVNEHPVIVVAIPGNTPGTFEPFAAVSGSQAVSFTSPIWDTIPPLPVQNIVLLQPIGYQPNPQTMIHLREQQAQNTVSLQPMGSQVNPQTMISIQALNCTECYNEFQININPEYATMLALDVSTIVAGQIPLARGVKVSDAIALVSLTDALGNNNPNQVKAIFGGWFTGVFTSSDLAGNVMQRALNPKKLDWNFQVFEGTMGINTMDNNTYAWQSKSITTYSGSFLRGDYSINTQGSIRFSQTSFQDINIPASEPSVLFQENARILKQPRSPIPPVKFPNIEPKWSDFDINPKPHEGEARHQPSNLDHLDIEPLYQDVTGPDFDYIQQNLETSYQDVTGPNIPQPTISDFPNWSELDTLKLNSLQNLESSDINRQTFSTP